MYRKLTEGNAGIIVPEEEKVSKKLPVFYNPVMELNRTVSVFVLNAIKNKRMRIALPLAGTGARAVRFLLELNKDKIKELHINDISSEAVKIINKNLRLNNIKLNNRIRISQKEANIFLLENSGFDYIDIDPFGTPNPFLDAAVKRITKGGIIAITATDTGCLAGTYPEACLRKYYAKPLRCEQMHEFGLRILIRKVQLIGAQFDKALMPVFSYFKDHYFRIFFLAETGKQKADKLLKKHGFVLYDSKTTELKASNIMHEKGFDSYAGPLWLGELWDRKLINKIENNATYDNKKAVNLINTIKEESKLSTVGFYHVHSLCKKNKIKKLPTHKELINKIMKAGFKAERTHFTDIGIRSDIGFEKLLKIMKK